MEQTYHYQASAHWIAARHGVVEGEGLPEKIYFAPPPEFEGEADKWTPEHLLVAAVASGVASTFHALAEPAKLGVLELTVVCEAVLVKKDSGFRVTQVLVRPTVTIAREADRDAARRLLQKANQACFVVRSLSAEVVLQPVVTAATAACA